MNDIQSLAHSKWNCKYNIVFVPKCRKQVIYGKLKAEIGKILRNLCERKGVEFIEANACPDHIHMFMKHSYSPHDKQNYHIHGNYFEIVIN